MAVTAGKLQQTLLKFERPGDVEWIALTDGAAELMHCFRARLEPVTVHKGDIIGLGILHEQDGFACRNKVRPTDGP